MPVAALSDITDWITEVVGNHGLYAVFLLMLVDAVFPAASELVMVYAGALAARIGPRLQMTVGPLLVAVGILLMARIEPGVSYEAGVLPAVVIMGLGLATTVAPLTSTALGSVDDRHAGVASGPPWALARRAASCSRSSRTAVRGWPRVAAISPSPSPR